VTYPVAYADRPNDAHWKNDTVTWEDILGWVASPAKRKECGNYILATLERTEKVHAGADGPCTDVHRDNRSVGRRSAVLALDIDAPETGFDVVVEMVLADHTYVMHTTHSSTPSEPRYRLLVQTDRDMAPDEYVEATQALALRLGKDQFDTGSFQAARFMFKPACKKPEWYDSWINEGVPVRVDDLLAEYDRDLSELPMPKVGKNKRDPYSIDGPVGAFNRVFEDLDVLIATYHLPYEKVSDDRYTLEGSSAEAGMGPVSGAAGLYYSHHANDPAYAVTCSAFDLVRLHLFGEEDESAKPGTPINKLPSNESMLDLAMRDPRVVNEVLSSRAEDDFSPVTDEDDEAHNEGWKGLLRLTNRGAFIDDRPNWDIVLKHEPTFSLLYFNELTKSPEVSADLPWRKVTPLSRTFDGTDHVKMRAYIEREIRFRVPKEYIYDLVVEKAVDNRVSPVRDYLESLVWDGKERVETCLPGVSDSRYNRLVARKILAAAVARVYEPGLKWDHTLVLHGPEGVGKSTWIEKLANVGLPERRTYHYTLGAINSKDTLLAMHMSWIVVSDEGHSLRKADNDALKEFLTRTHDVFRMPYDRDTVVHPRQCVIWSTTNDDTFLRRQEGNRRFLMVRCLERFDIEAMTQDVVDQLWAEAVAMYKAGEQLWLTDDESLLAELERDPFLEEDTNAGVLENFLAMQVPLDWWDRSPEARQEWKEGRAHGFEQEGDIVVDRTCSRQLWHEALGQRVPPRRADLLEITASLKALGWVSSGHAHFPGYGTQTIFVRKDDML
jgi:putative DNA primase/helicase